MSETLTGKQVLALLAQDEVPEIEYSSDGHWFLLSRDRWSIEEFRITDLQFRIKPTRRRLSVTLANGEVVSWPEPVREALKNGKEYWFVDFDGVVEKCEWDGGGFDKKNLAFGNCHLTKENAQEHADALRRINTQGVTC